MGKKWRIGVLILLTLIAVGFIWSLSGPREPLYMGKSVRYWLGATVPKIDPSGRLNFIPLEFPTADSNAVPALIKALNTKDGTGHRIYAWVWNKSPTWVKTRLRVPLPDVIIRERAIWWLRELGVQAKPAIPALIQMMKDDAGGNMRWPVLQALWAIDKNDPAARAALDEAKSFNEVSTRIRTQ